MKLCAGAPKSFSVREAPSTSLITSSIILENMVTVRSLLLVPMITVAKVVIEHLVSFCIMAHLLHSPKLLSIALTLALQAHWYSVNQSLLQRKAEDQSLMHTDVITIYRHATRSL